MLFPAIFINVIQLTTKSLYFWDSLYLMNADGSDKRVLTESLDRSIETVRWSGGSNQLMFQYDERGKKRLATLSLEGQMETLADDVGGTSPGRPYSSGGSFSVSGNGAYAYTSTTPYRPSDVAVGRLGSAPQKLTRLNEDFLAHKTLAQIEELTWTTSVGDYEIQGWVMKPPNFDPNNQYPLILEIHGGPLAAYGPTFSIELQLYAAAGYVVLYCNPRGSTSYGYDFANEIHHNYPSKDYDDLMSGVDAVIANGYVDEDHLYVTGGSGGGVLTAWIVGKTGRFRAAVSAKPVINWNSEVLTTDIMVHIKYWFPKAPWEAPEHYWEHSPLSLVGNVTTPTMLITDEQDHRTPITESEQYYQALKFRKIETALVRVPEASHGIAARPSHLIAKVDNILGWFEKYKEKKDTKE